MQIPPAFFINKTKIIWIGSEKNSEQVFCEDLNLCWDNSDFTVLGVKFTKNISEITGYPIMCKGLLFAKRSPFREKDYLKVRKGLLYTKKNSI